MCLALPMRIVAVEDADARTVRIEPASTIAGDRAAVEIVSAALLADDDASLATLVGGWGVAHAGFLLQILSDEDARSRLVLFEAMDRAVGAIDGGDDAFPLREDVAVTRVRSAIRRDPCNCPDMTSPTTSDISAETA